MYLVRAPSTLHVFLFDVFIGRKSVERKKKKSFFVPVPTLVLYVRLIFVYSILRSGGKPIPCRMQQPY